MLGRLYPGLLELIDQSHTYLDVCRFQRPWFLHEGQKRALGVSESLDSRAEVLQPGVWSCARASCPGRELV